MNFIRQKMVSLRNRARDLQTTLRRWSMYDDAVSRELKEDLLARLTPAEETTFETDQELTKTRLRPVSVQLQTVWRWYDFVLERINEQLSRARELLDQGRHHECLQILNDVEARMLAPNEETLGYVFRALQQHTSHEYHQKLATIDAIIRDLYLPTVKLAHQRGIISKEALSRTPVAFLADTPDASYCWRLHRQQAVNFGRILPVSLLPVPRRFTAQPWNLAGIAYEVGTCVMTDLELAWEIVNKLQVESINAGVSAQTAAIWARWHETVFADVFGVLKLGPAYVSGMIELLGTDAVSAITLRTDAPVPPAYIRWHLMLQTLQMLNFNEEALDLFNQIHLLCGDPNQLAQRCGPEWLQLVNECRAVSGVVAFSPYQRLAGARVVDLAEVFHTTEQQQAAKVKDLLLSGDESCSSDDSFTWLEPLGENLPGPRVALAGLRMAFNASADFETSQRMWVRFWCLLQYVTSHTEPVREREDREFAPGDATLRSLAEHSMPAAVVQPPQPVPVMA